MLRHLAVVPRRVLSAARGAASARKVRRQRLHAANHSAGKLQSVAPTQHADNLEAGQVYPLPRLQIVIQSLQGDWGDDIGLQIQIIGSEAFFSDGTGPWPFEWQGSEEDGAPYLRGAKFVGTVQAPMWRFRTGVERHWARTKAAGADDGVWARHFLSFKAQRLHLRHELRKAYEAIDCDRIAMLKASEEDHPSSQGLTDRQQTMLHDGRWILPGVCFRHRKFGYTGVVFGHDATCSFPAAWRARWVPGRPDAEAQPYYHCIVDERDRPGFQTRYVAQENMEPDDLIFPVQSRLADDLLLRCDAIGCYLPGKLLSGRLQQQEVMGSFFGV
mmetsp:Transcript_110827/g.220431  ORF Transcript_110827/g.220431 Transcript_110827/m.220431 type:complete len:329 (+) Transcript_110827:70-1056(+)